MDARAIVHGYLRRAGCRRIRPSAEGFDAACPFHSSWHKSKGLTLGVNVTKGKFFCQSAVCGRAGLLMTLLIEKCGYSYQKAREVQLSFAGGTPPPLESQRMCAWHRRQTAESDHEPLNPGVLGAYARCPTYMLRRGFEKEILRQWDVGYDPDADAVTLPVWTIEGWLWGITRRICDDTLPVHVPRYLHAFPRSEVLYGEHRVERVSAENPLVVVEGQPSVLWLAQHGVPNAVATFGSRVAPPQVRRMAHHKHVVLAFDGDGAGQAATRAVGGRLSRWLAPEKLHVVADYPKGTKDPSECEDPRQLLGTLWCVSWADWWRQDVARRVAPEVAA